MVIIHHLDSSAWLNPSSGFYEKMPYSHGSMRSIYHIREYNFRRLALVRVVYLVMAHQRMTIWSLALKTTYLPLTRLAGVY